MNTVTRSMSRRRKLTRLARLRKRRRKAIGVFLSIILLVGVIGGISINKISTTKKLKDLTYAIDYYLTNAKDKDYRLKSVQTMSLIDKTADTVTIEANGLSIKPPYATTTVVGYFTKQENGMWTINDLSKR